MDDDAGAGPENEAGEHRGGPTEDSAYDADAVPASRAAAAATVEGEDAQRFRLAYVPGATPAKWVRTWRERHPDVPLDLVATDAADAERVLRDGEADAAILRLPVDRDVLAAIPLYEETPVVLVSRDHLLAALDAVEAVALDDLADDVLQRPLDDVVAWAGERGAATDAPPAPGVPAAERPATTADAVVLVAAGVGVLVVPQSLARLHHRKDVVYRRLDGAPPAPVALAWVADRADDLVEEMIGIVRGRTVNSSRGRSATPDDASPGAGRPGGGRERSGGGGARGRAATGGAGRGGTGRDERGGAGAGRGGAGTGRRAGSGGSGRGASGGRGTRGGRGRGRRR